MTEPEMRPLRDMPDGAFRRAYEAAAAKCINAGDDCDQLCAFCRDMVDAALRAAGLDA